MKRVAVFTFWTTVEFFGVILKRPCKMVKDLSLSTMCLAKGSGQGVQDSLDLIVDELRARVVDKNIGLFLAIVLTLLSLIYWLLVYCLIFCPIYLFTVSVFPSIGFWCYLVIGLIEGHISLLGANYLTIAMHLGLMGIWVIGESCWETVNTKVRQSYNEYKDMRLVKRYNG